MWAWDKCRMQNVIAIFEDYEKNIPSIALANTVAPSMSLLRGLRNFVEGVQLAATRATKSVNWIGLANNINWIKLSRFYSYLLLKLVPIHFSSFIRLRCLIKLSKSNQHFFIREERRKKFIWKISRRFLFDLLLLLNQAERASFHLDKKSQQRCLFIDVLPARENCAVTMRLTSLFKFVNLIPTCFSCRGAYCTYT